MIDLPTVSLLSAALTVVLLTISQLQILRGPHIGLRSYAPAMLAILVVIVYALLRFYDVLSANPARLGGKEDALVLAVIFLGVVGGIVANRLMEFGSGPIDWQSVLIPLVVSPLVVSPVWSMFDSSSMPEPGFRQYVSFAFSGFTSGYSFRSIIEKLRSGS